MSALKKFVVESKSRDSFTDYISFSENIRKLVSDNSTEQGGKGYGSFDSISFSMLEGLLKYIGSIVKCSLSAYCIYESSQSIRDGGFVIGCYPVSSTNFMQDSKLDTQLACREFSL